MCGRTHDRRYKDADFVGDMPLALVQKLDRLYGKSSFVIATGLGEPFLNPEFMEILAYLKKKEATVSLTSNGTFLTEDQAKALVEAKVDRIVFSIDSPDSETFKQIRIGADLDQIVKNIERLVQIREKSGTSLPYLILEFVAMAKNFHQLPQVADLANQLNFNEVIVQNLFKHFAPGYNAFYRKNKLSVLEPEEALSYWKEFVARLKRYSIEIYSPFQGEGIHQYLGNRRMVKEKETLPSSAFIGFIDRPKPLERHSGACHITGWVLGEEGFPIAEIRLESATESFQSPISASVVRPDVLPALPSTHPQDPNCGFDQLVDISHLKSGVFTLSLMARKSKDHPSQAVARQQIFVSRGNDLKMYCSQPWSTIYVAWDGKLRTCCFNEYLLGDLGVDSFERIWKGRTYRDLRRKVIRGDILEECADCLGGMSNPNYISSLSDFLSPFRKTP
jgi:MoaA/NifB/PqqE/SkfB family radical SAM enzyme